MWFKGSKHCYSSHEEILTPYYCSVLWFVILTVGSKSSLSNVNGNSFRKKFIKRLIFSLVSVLKRIKAPLNMT